MKKYISMFRINYLMNLQYRAAAYAGMSTQFFWGFMTILMFKAFYETDIGGQASSFPMEFSQLVNYIWMQQAFLAMFFAYQIEGGIYQSIIDGNVAYELCRPADLYFHWLAKIMSMRLSRATLRCAPILIVAALLPAPYGLTAPRDIMAFALFLMSMPLAFIAANAFAMLIYISIFYTISPNGTRFVISTITDFLIGGIIPLPFFPEGFLKIIELTPFAAMQNVPLRIYSGGIEPVRAIALQIFWIIALLFIGRFFMSRTLRRVVVQGG